MTARVKKTDRVVATQDDFIMFVSLVTNAAVIEIVDPTGGPPTAINNAAHVSVAVTHCPVSTTHALRCFCLKYSYFRQPLVPSSPYHVTW